jgi:hypothetical protein
MHTNRLGAGTDIILLSLSERWSGQVHLLWLLFLYAAR